MDTVFTKVKEWDPFNLVSEPKYKRVIMILLYVAIGTATLALLLYLFLELFSDRNSKLSKYNKKVKEWKQTTDSQKLSDIGMGIRITPSENTEGNIILMNYHTQGLLKEQKLNKVYNYSQAYYLHTDTRSYFPVFNFVYDEVPVGDSESYCIHLRWTPKETAKMLDLYNDVEEFPQCSKAFNPKVVWREHDSKYGVEINAWTQTETVMTGCDTKKNCQKKCDKYNGIVKKTYTKAYVCYSYKVLTDICLMVSHNSSGVWNYAGGCFEGGSPSRMVDAVPGETYVFNEIRIQVRSVADPYIIATQENANDPDFSFGSDVDFLYTIALVVLIIGLSLIHICRCRRYAVCRSRWSPYH
eukprot:TRINITY_DN11076_c0_g1_i5.p1 TRINITY_DN11076_c0_g1~~TRINITY_DN11076_c0_g1_i5.p1  ORF type:complete len:355 (-),score=97.79 TRINITY_DN11076_c0_g1_i5:22-1086(-)